MKFLMTIAEVAALQRWGLLFKGLPKCAWYRYRQLIMIDLENFFDIIALFKGIIIGA